MSEEIADINQIIDSAIEEARNKVCLTNALYKILYDDYGLIYGKHYAEAGVVGTKDGYRIIFQPIKKIKYLEFELGVEKKL